MLGLSRQHADQLTRTRGFPDPVERVAALDRRTVEQMSEQMEVRFAGDVVTFGEALDALDDGAITLPPQPRLWRLEEVETWATANGRMQAVDGIAGQARSVRNTVPMEAIIKVVRAQRQLLQELGREPTTEEVAQRVELSIERVHRILRFGYTAEYFDEEPVRGKEDYNPPDVIEDGGAVALAEAMQGGVDWLNEGGEETATARFEKALALAIEHGSEEVVERIRGMVEIEDPVTGRVRPKRYDEIDPMLLETRTTRTRSNRVRQIESRTRAKIRRPDVAHPLRDYLEEDSPSDEPKRAYAAERLRAVTAFDDDTLHVDFVQREVTLDGQPVHLSSKEYVVLVTLVRREGQPVSVPELIAHIWGDDAPPGGGTLAVRSYIAHLRRKLAGHGPGAIETVQDGYRYRS